MLVNNSYKTQKVIIKENIPHKIIRGTRNGINMIRKESLENDEA